MGVLLIAAASHADPDAPDVMQESARFSKAVELGDRARRAHQYSAAIAKYNEALDIHDDPAVGGRLGLALLEVDQYAAAAEYLLQAMTKAQAAPSLMQQFHNGFARVRSKVCLIEVFVSEGAADIEIDGELEPSGNRNAFHAFVVGGSHVLRAKLAGFEDATATIDTPAGGQTQVTLNLRRLTPPPSPPVQAAPTSNWGPDPSLSEKPANVGKPAHRLSDSYTRFLLGAGGLFVVGATPGASVGPQMIGGVRRGNFSLNLDARLAWALGTPDRALDLQLVTWAIGVRPCVHYKVLLGCGLVQIGGLQSLSENFVHQQKVSGGIRGGLEFVLHEPLRLQIWGEGLVQGDGYEVVRDGSVIWRGSPVTGGFGMTTLLTW